MKRSLAIWGAACTLAGCAAVTGPVPAGKAGAAPDVAMGRTLYMEYCAVCHGESGRGDGVLAADLPVSPADLTGIARRNGGAFPWSETMAKVHGYSGRADVMPEFGTVLTGPSVTWLDETGTPIETPKGLLAIARYLASIQA